ncbi:hypothetical protein AK812_SmicGene18748 [Symbiodinium microadriaticum]|uniref:Uncharacterized protein n=1 Tax=Symbiodinium microadriaticum TaxID=2951 RepID=A0A1Q9DUG5_SYMMI|nr:hypothetical protein AK812_SmicGene18748 [Symbiodinium microadriaticum]
MRSVVGQSQSAVIILVQCDQMVSSPALDTTCMISVTCQQIWDQFRQLQRALVTLVQCGQMVSSSALDSAFLGSVTSHQIWDQFWHSQQAVIILVQCGQMASSSALDTTGMGSVTSQQIWDQFRQLQRALVTLVQCGQMVSSSALETIVMGSVTSQQIWDQFGGSLSYLCCAEGTHCQLVCFNLCEKSHVLAATRIAAHWKRKALALGSRGTPKRKLAALFEVTVDRRRFLKMREEKERSLCSGWSLDPGDTDVIVEMQKHRETRKKMQEDADDVFEKAELLEERRQWILDYCQDPEHQKEFPEKFDAFYQRFDKAQDDDEVEKGKDGKKGKDAKKDDKAKGKGGKGGKKGKDAEAEEEPLEAELVRSWSAIVGHMRAQSEGMDVMQGTSHGLWHFAVIW